LPEKMQKDFILPRDDAAELLREIANALEEKDQLNMEFEEEKLIQPLDGEIPLRIYQEESGTEIGFKLKGKIS